MTYVLRVQHSGYNRRPAFIFVSDRWNPTNLADSRIIFLPLTIPGKGDISVKWYDQWDLSVFGTRNQRSVER